VGGERGEDWGVVEDGQGGWGGVTGVWGRCGWGYDGGGEWGGGCLGERPGCVIEWKEGLGGRR